MTFSLSVHPTLYPYEVLPRGPREVREQIRAAYFRSRDAYKPRSQRREASCPRFLGFMNPPALSRPPSGRSSASPRLALPRYRAFFPGR